MMLALSLRLETLKLPASLSQVFTGTEVAFHWQVYRQMVEFVGKNLLFANFCVMRPGP
jgi:hypothetical protein